MKTEYAQEVATKIIQQLQQGTAPWQKPWKPGELSMPYNASTGKEYRGINSLWLYMQGHGDPRWMTYNQAADAGAQVRKGQKGTKIVYWKFYDEQKATDANGKPILDENGKPTTIRVELERPRAFHAVVFNAEQIDGLPALEPKQIGSEPERHARAEAILSNSGASIQHVAGNRAFYQPSTDSITLPERSQFDAADGYYATALHELGHWTGHPSRLDRDLAHPFGSEGYAREELRAEIASLMLGERLEIGHDPGQHAAYVASWVKALQDDPREIFRAAADAEKIAAYVMAFEQEKAREQAREQPVAEAVLLEAASISRGEHATTQDRRVDRILARENYLQELAKNRPQIATDVAKAWRENAAHYSDVSGLSPDSVNAYAGVIERQIALFAPKQAEADDPETKLRALWTEQGVPKERQDALIAEIEALAAPGAQVGPFVIPGDSTVLHHPPEKPVSDRTYLAVPYAEKDKAKAAAKAAGFQLQWDKENKAWFAPAGANLSSMERWKADGPNVQKPQVKSVEDQFRDALKAAGLHYDDARDGKIHPIADGKIHRLPLDGDKGSETGGAYAFHLEGRTAGGFIQNFKTGEVVNWKPQGTVAQVSPEERAKLAAEAAERQRQRAAETEAKHGATAAAAQALWDHSPAATPDNAYCQAKGITDTEGLRTVPDTIPEAVAKAHNIQIAKTVQQAKAMRDADPEARVFKAGDLLIPAYAQGALSTLQSVNPHFKSFMKGGQMQGAMTLAGRGMGESRLLEYATDSSTPMIVAEGFATADSVAKLSGQPVHVAFNSGNLDAVVRQLRELNPGRTILIAADNDHKAEKDGKPNVGMEKAGQAAQAHGAGVIAPYFKEGEKGSDWNDLLQSRGAEEAQRDFDRQMALAKREAAINAERLTTLAREREQEARNDPTTSADDAQVAAERGKAAEAIANATEQVVAVRNAADAGKAASKGTGRKPAVATAKATLDRQNGQMLDQVKADRQEVQNHAHEADDKQTPGKPAQAKAKRPRARGVEAGM